MAYSFTLTNNSSVSVSIPFDRKYVGRTLTLKINGVTVAANVSSEGTALVLSVAGSSVADYVGKTYTITTTIDGTLTTVQSGNIYDGRPSSNVTDNGTGGGSVVAPTFDNLPATTAFVIIKPAGGSWPARPSARTDLCFFWKGPEPSPAIITSGTGGMLDGVDVRLVTP